MNIAQIEDNLTNLSDHFDKADFIFKLLLAYGFPKTTVTLLKNGRYNLSKQEGTIILKRKLYFHETTDADLHETIDSLQKDPSANRHSPRFIVVTDYETLLAIDTKTNEHLDIPIVKVAKHYDFFLPWAGIEKHRQVNENPADRKAAEKMAKLYDQILAENNIVSADKVHALNVFLSRLLFCFFAEDTNIFKPKLFVNSIASHTQEDGSDFSVYLETLFDVLNSQERSNYPNYLHLFPYVNGGLFEKKQWIPQFSARSRRIIIECGELDWSTINPDIFGSMMQAVVHPSERGDLGMHYTSVPNIMKVIKPLFLNAIKEEVDKCGSDKKKLEGFSGRLSKMKFFDPACGSGNFLVIAYKELRRLEMIIIKETRSFSFSTISLKQFYGIEIDDFAHEIAKLSLYLAEHQMNIEFKQAFGEVNPTLPLRTGGNIVCANAARIDWEGVCPKNDNDEIYIFGNPPYSGARKQSAEQKRDMKLATGHIKSFKNLDYIACWFFKAAHYIRNINSRFSFVSTNSICQGSQISLLWPNILKDDLEIYFAYHSFKWSNNAKRNAGVTCVIVGVRNIDSAKKYLYKGQMAQEVSSINGYLLHSTSTIVEGRRNALSNLPPINYGSFALDDGNYTLTKKEAHRILHSNSEAHRFIAPFIGAKELINGEERYCVWIKNDTISDAKKIPSIYERIQKVQDWRKKSSRGTTNKLAQEPHMFAEIRQPVVTYLAFPTVSSERRNYIPIRFLESNVIASNQIYVIPTSEPWVLGIVSSWMHMTWVRAVAGRLETRIRYSAAVCYNTFPIPSLTLKQKEELNRHVLNILDEREKNPEKTMAELYDPDKMPDGLREAHHHLDLAVERCYRSKPFMSDEERLEYLFKLYEQMIREEKNLHNAI